MTGNDDQIAYWNDRAGQTWSALQPLLDAQIAPPGLAAMDALAPAPGERLLDIGCGCGDTSLALAGRVAPGGRVVGADISAPMLAVARARGAGVAGVRFVQADVQSAALAPEALEQDALGRDALDQEGARQGFDAAFSRFGVMFFADPVAAFANVRAMLRPGGRLGFVCWRTPAENPWMMVPMDAAMRHLPAQVPQDPLAHGPYAFADPARVRGILTAAGFGHVDIRAHDVPLGGFALDQAMVLALRVGPLGRLLQEAPAQREVVVDSVRAALAAVERKGAVWLASGTWIVTAW